MGDFNMCEPEEGRFNVWNQTFTEGDMGKAAFFHSLFPGVLEIAQPDFPRRDSSVNGVFRTLTRIDRAFINLSMAEARDFHCYSHVFVNLGKRTRPSDHAAARVVNQTTRLVGDTRANAFRVGCRNIPFSVQSWNRSMTITGTLTSHLVHFADVKIYHRKSKADCSRALTQDTGQPGSQVVTSLQKQAPRPGKRQCLGEMQTWTSRLARQETNALPSRCYRRRRPSPGKRK